MKILSAMALVALSLTASGCGTILHGGNEQILIQSEPSGAEVFNSGVRIGRTPMTATLPRSSAHTLTFRLDGYDEESFQISRGIDGLALVGDILLGIVPIVIDFATGAVYNLSPDQAIVVLRESRASLPTQAGPDELQIAVFTRAEVEAILGEQALVGATAR